jgi:hypothetical protein
MGGCMQVEQVIALYTVTPTLHACTAAMQLAMPEPRPQHITECALVLTLLNAEAPE